MKLYVWKLEYHDCYCSYSVIAENLEEAREVVIYSLTKDKGNECNMCIASEYFGDYRNMSFKKKRERMEYLLNRGDYVIRNWIRDAEPSTYETKKLIRG